MVTGYTNVDKFIAGQRFPKIDESDTPWEDKIEMAFFRGGHAGASTDYFPQLYEWWNYFPT